MATMRKGKNPGPVAVRTFYRRARSIFVLCWIARRGLPALLVSEKALKDSTKAVGVGRSEGPTPCSRLHAACSLKH